MVAKIHLLASKQHSILLGHPWVFPKAIKKILGKPTNGELVYLYDANEKNIGVGVFNEHSLYRVRVLLLKDNLENPSLESIVKLRLQQAVQVRTLLHLPNNNTDAYRLFNSEADGLSGLTIDCFGQVLVISSSAYWVQDHQIMITQLVQELFPNFQILWSSQGKALQQDGWDEVITTAKEIKTEILEAGVLFQIEFNTSQKTGLFLDQRENHQRIALLAKGKRVLDLYSYTGGFALHAAKAGASFVTAVDSSGPAIQQAKKNAQLNNLTQIEFIEADARDYLTKASDYDIVILDPPKLVPSRQHAEKAKNYYRFLHREIFKSMKSGSLLMTCNCSSALNAQEFSYLASQQARTVGKETRIIGIYGPASCHPTLAEFAEGNYLTAVLLAVV